MCRGTQTPNWNAGAALRKLLEVDPWFAIGVIDLLTPEQWNALRSGEVFNAIRQKLVRMAWRTHRGVPGDTASIAEEAASEALYRLTSRKFLKRFDAAKGVPNAYMSGTAWRYLAADRRSRFTRLRHEQGLTREPASSGFSDPADTCERNDVLAIVLKLLEELPHKQRDAIKQRFLATDRTDGPSSRAECIQRCRGLKAVREEVRKRGLME